MRAIAVVTVDLLVQMLAAIFAEGKTADAGYRIAEELAQRRAVIANAAEGRRRATNPSVVRWVWLLPLSILAGNDSTAAKRPAQRPVSLRVTDEVLSCRGLELCEGRIVADLRARGR